jgi:hypothetical protein
MIKDSWINGAQVNQRKVSNKSAYALASTKEKAPRRALLFNADYNLVAITTHDPKEGQEIGEDVVYV